ncbi:hypothetical protein HWV62_11634 [Athelia sp. TMB]|nr:hypothetical protein HWV62_11634 [Athelia sp. TMB]
MSETLVRHTSLPLHRESDTPQPSMPAPTPIQPATLCLNCGAGLTPTHSPPPSSPPVIAHLPAPRTLAQLQQDLAILDSDIAHAHAALAALLARRRATQATAQALAGAPVQALAGAPVHRLPVELLAKIFEHTLPAFPAPNRPQSALVLESVCKRWGSVACGASALWAGIALTLGCPRDLAAAEVCLSRAGGCGLEIAVRAEDGYALDKAGHEALALLAAHSDRWRVVHLDRLPVHVLAHLEIVRGRLPALERLSVSTTAEDPEDTPTELTAFEFAPKLRSLEVKSQSYADVLTRGALALPWGALTRLTIDRHHARDLCAVLSLCENLEHLEAELSSHVDGLIPPVLLPRLRTLALELPQHATLLPALILPALAEARFTVFGAAPRRDPWHVASGLAVLLDQSGCAIRKLGLRVDAYEREALLSAADLAGVLGVLTGLEELEVSEALGEMLGEVGAEDDGVKGVLGRCRIATSA